MIPLTIPPHRENPPFSCSDFADWTAKLTFWNECYGVLSKTIIWRIADAHVYSNGLVSDLSAQLKHSPLCSLNEFRNEITISFFLSKWIIMTPCKQLLNKVIFHCWIGIYSFECTFSKKEHRDQKKTAYSLKWWIRFFLKTKCHFEILFVSRNGNLFSSQFIIALSLCWIQTQRHFYGSDRSWLRYNPFGYANLAWNNKYSNNLRPNIAKVNR